MEGEIKRLKVELDAANDKYEALTDYLLLKRGDFGCCSYCRLIRHETDTVWCKVNGEHEVCATHELVQTNDLFWKATCIICIEARKKKAKQALVSFSVCLKRKGCHKDVYNYLFIPLMKKMRDEAKKRDKWDIN